MSVQVEKYVPVVGPHTPVTARVVHVSRRRDGSWRMLLDLFCDISLPDGRQVLVDGPVIVRGKQIGRKGGA